MLTLASEETPEASTVRLLMVPEALYASMAAFELLPEAVTVTPLATSVNTTVSFASVLKEASAD